jgi:hypothetical protein
MKHSLQNIFQFEESQQFEEAFEAYSQLYSDANTDYEVWKHFYFFLWIATEDAPEIFAKKINLTKSLEAMLTDGIKFFLTGRILILLRAIPFQ